MDLVASFKSNKPLWIGGGLVVLIVGYALLKKGGTAAGAGSTSTLPWTTGSAGDAGRAATGPGVKDFLPLSDPNHVFTTGEVQYLLNLWGSSPLPPQSGSYDDTTNLAVRDFQTRGTEFGPMDVTGDPFDVGTSRALQSFASSLLSSGAPLTPSGSITYSDVQTLLGLPVTGVLDAPTQTKLNLYATLIDGKTPVTLQNPAVVAYFTTMAQQARLWGG